MNISCPICNTSIEVSQFLVGHKGRCPKCASKFIIPENPDDHMEILERGSVPAEDSAPAAGARAAAPAPVAPPAAPSRSEPAPAAAATPVAAQPAAAAAPKMVTLTGGPARTPARPVIVKQSSGAFGFLFAIVLAALVGVVVYVMADKNDGAPKVAERPKPEQPAVVEKPRPRPVAPVVEPVEVPEPVGIPVYSKVIQPILDAKCISCHGEEKRKGRLAMHSFESLSAGSGNGPVIEADPDDEKRIEMIFRAELPEADDEHMPPQGKPQLTSEELAILKWWIQEGANQDIESSEAPDDIRATIESLAASGRGV